MIKHGSAIALALLLSVPAFAQDGDKPQPEAPDPKPSKASLAVLPFTFATAVLERDRDGDWGWAIKNFETTAFTNKFVTALVNTRKFDIVERQRIDDLLKEMQLTTTGITDPKRAVKAGQAIGADYVLMGEISVFEILATWMQVPGTTRWSVTLTGRIIVDMRIVDSRTSRVVAADKGEVEHETKALFDHRVEIVVDGKYIDTMQRTLCEDLVIKTIDGVYPVKVMAFSGGVVNLNRGEGGGLAVGQVLDVYVEGQEMVDPDTGETLGAEEVKIGRIKVTEILPRFSKAAVVETSSPIPQGAICRKAKEQPAPAQEPARRGPKW